MFAISVPYNIAFNTGYFQNLSPQDLQVRGFKSNDEYAKAYQRDVVKISNKQLNGLSDVLAYVDSLFYENRLKRMSKLPWNIWLSSNQIECGLPHTFGNAIVLPAAMVVAGNLQLVDTLVHEKIHVFQRMFPVICNKLYLLYWKFHVFPVSIGIKNRRSNPDITDILYTDTTGQVIVGRYKDKLQISLTDIEDKRDHPNEMMAYILTSKIMKVQVQEHLMQYSDEFDNWINDFHQYL